MSKIYIQVVGEDEFFDQTWPDGWRIPCIGEVLLIGPDQFMVLAVQWELDQDDDTPSVQLRVGR